MTTTTIPVSGLSCHHCVATVTRLLTASPVIDAVEIDLDPGGVSQVTVTADRDVSDSEVQSLLSAGSDFTVSR